MSARAEAERSSRAFCANVSNASAEPLAATASRIDTLDSRRVPRGAGTATCSGAACSPGRAEGSPARPARRARDGRASCSSRRPERRGTHGGSSSSGRSRPGEERFFALEFDRHDDLVGLDFAAALAGERVGGRPVSSTRCFVVCTHGKRDRCCAKYGRPLYDELRREAESGWVWQSTHVGGDRFAGNVVVLPARALLRAGRARRRLGLLLAEHAAGRIWLERYRGRCRLHLSGAGGGAGRAGGTRAGGHRRPRRRRLARRTGRAGASASRDAGARVHEVDVAEEPASRSTSPAARRPPHARRYVAHPPADHASLTRRKPSRTRRRTRTSRPASSRSPGRSRGR